MPGRGRGTKRTGAPVEDTQVETMTPKDPPAKKTRNSSTTATTPLQAAEKPDDHVGQRSGKDPTLELWQKGTSESEWDCKVPTSLETPDHLAISCPPITQQAIWAGGYVNLACFIPPD
jgi:hypothetical protein